MKLVEHYGNISKKVHKVAWNLHEIDFAIMRSHLTTGVSGNLILFYTSHKKNDDIDHVKRKHEA